MPVLSNDPKKLTYGEYRKRILEKFEKNPDDPDPEVQKLKKELEEFNPNSFINYLRKASLRILMGQSASTAFLELASRFPQASQGKLHYLLTSGLAIDFYTESRRRHRDIDLVVVNGLLTGGHTF